MVGIISYGAHIPFYRISREEVAKAWGKKGGAGERAVAGGDEDAITMGVEAGYDCLRGMDPEKVDGLYFATTTPPYAQKQSASLISAALNLRKDINTVDVGHSLRGGTSALKAALDAIGGGSAKKAMVVASEVPLGVADSAKELEYGDGAAALLIGDSDVAVTVEGSYSMTSEFLDTWRLPGDRFAQEWEDRFIRDEGYTRLLPQAVSGLLKKYNLKPGDFNKVVYNGLDTRIHVSVARKMGFDYKTQVQDPLYGRLGNTGTASALMMLIATLEEAKGGERILLANYADGADAFILKVTDQIEKVRDRRGIRGNLNSKMMLSHYGKYLHFRNLMEWEVDRRPPPRTSLTHYFRESKQLFGLVGQRCKSCGHEQFPRQRICMWCQARMERPEEYEDVPLAYQTGVLFTFSMDERAPVADLPNVLSVVDLEGGARYYGLMTDRDPTKIKIGQQMEFTFRKINDAQGVHNYFWKVRPVRS
jgi:hydroxymethylglutaryl-CoA synthase